VSPLGATLVFALALCMPVCVWLGKRIADREWRQTAGGYVRIASGEHLYHVVREGDVRKARAVLEAAKLVEHEG
jgi:hypothetical protein